MKKFTVSDGHLSLFTPMTHLIEEEHFSTRCANILQWMSPLLGDLVSMKRADIMRTSGLGKMSMAEIDVTLEQIAGYWIGYTIPPEHEWWVYRPLFNRYPMSVFSEIVSPNLLEWLHKEQRYEYLWQLVIGDPEAVYTYLGREGMSPNKVDDCLSKLGLSLGMELSAEVSESVRFFASKIE